MSRSERGAAAVEFALVAPLLIALLVGIAEFGRAYYLQAMVSGSARETVRSLALKGSTAVESDVRLTAKTAASPVILSDGQIVLTKCPALNPETANARVTINYTTSFMSGFFGAPLELTGTGVMRCGG